ncbi:MAG: DUF3987 domain-containing protein [Desertifilum sp.]|nr:DUF3987 domain-containing protein [Desertifilum sp.]
MNKFIVTRQDTRCPVCDNFNGNCRISPDYNLVLCYHLSEPGDEPVNPQDWTWTGHSKGSGTSGLWGKWVATNIDPEARKRYLQQATVSANRVSRAIAMSPKVEIRDKVFASLRKQYQLLPEDRANLKARGLTDDQIELGSFFSFEPGIMAPEDCPDNFPGHAKGKLWSNGGGIACPAKNLMQQISGVQIRKRGSNPEGGRYAWLKAGNNSSHLPNGEFPIHFARPDIAPKDIKFDGVILCEGFLKAQIAAFRTKARYIGAAGGRFTASPSQLNEILDTGDREVFIAPDAGDVKNPKVMGRWLSELATLNKWGICPQVLWWGQIDKTENDIDELTKEEFTQVVKIINQKEFVAVAEANGGIVVDKPASTTLIDRITKAYNSTAGVHLSAELAAIAKEFGYPTQIINKLAAQIESDAGVHEARSDIRDRLTLAKAASSAKLNIDRLLPPKLAGLLTLRAKELGVPVEAMFTALLPLSASFVRPETQVMGALGYTEPLIFYTAGVAESGNKKSVILNDLTHAVIQWEKTLDIEYAAEMRRYKAVCNEIKDKGEHPEEPKRTDIYFQTFTTEALTLHHGYAISKGYAGVIIKDELSSLINGANQYKSKGDDIEFFLTASGGKNSKKNLISRETAKSDMMRCSIAGFTQPRVLQSCFKSTNSDATGFWGRFLLMPYKCWYEKLPQKYSAQYDLQAHFYKVCMNVRKIVGQTLKLSAEAQEVFEGWRLEIQTLLSSENNPHLKNALYKYEGMALRMVGMLRLIKSAELETTDIPDITAAEMRNAVDALRFYYAKYMEIALDGEAYRGDNLAIYHKILDKCEELGGLTASQAKQQLACLKLTPTSDIRHTFNVLASIMGDRVRVEGEGVKTRLVPTGNRTEQVFEVSNTVIGIIETQNPELAVRSESYSDSITSQEFDLGLTDESDRLEVNNLPPLNIQLDYHPEPAVPEFIDPDEITDEQLEAMSHAELEKYMTWFRTVQDKYDYDTGAHLYDIYLQRCEKKYGRRN